MIGQHVQHVGRKYSTHLETSTIKDADIDHN